MTGHHAPRRWRLCGEGEEPAGLREALTRTSAPHLRRIGIGGGLGDNAISHPGIPAAAVAEALAYACDDLPPALRHAASAWSIELRTIGRDDVVIIAINTMER